MNDAKPTKKSRKTAAPKTAVAKRDPKQLPAIPTSVAVEAAKSALESGAKALRDLAPTVLAKLAEHIEAGPTDPHYEWSMKLVAERLIPARAIAAAGIKHLGGDATGSSAPNIQINVVAANPREVPASIEVKALPVFEDEDPGND
jgi:hypothetical protein